MTQQSMDTHRIRTELFEIVESVLSLKLHMKNLIFSIVGGFSIGASTAFINDWIFDPAMSYMALILLIVSDHLTGVAIAFQNNKFETRKALRIFWTVLSHTALLMFATHLSKGSDALFWLNEAVFVPIVLVNLLSLVKNMSLLGWINAGLAEILYKRIDAYKNQYTDDKPKVDQPN